MTRAAALVILLTAMASPHAEATGHGPVYGLATPTLGRGGWSIDVSVMDREVGDTSSAMLRPLLTYGITEDLQASVSLPMPLYMPAGVPAARTMAMMPSSKDVELLLGWRFHRRGSAVGARVESTAYVGFDYPVDYVRAGVRTAPGLYGSVVTGYASRSFYVWGGGLYRRYMGTPGAAAERPGDVALYSLVVGYRPKAFRKELPHADWRVFVEALGEHVGKDHLAGAPLPNTGGRQFFVGPTVLGLYGSWGISGGPLFRVGGRPNGPAERDRVRIVVNYTYWF